MQGTRLALAAKLGQPWRDRPKMPVAIPFDAHCRYDTVLHGPESRRLILLKGAPEAVLERREGGKPSTAHDGWSGRRPWPPIARACWSRARKRAARDEVADRLTLLRPVGLIDPPCER